MAITRLHSSVGRIFRQRCFYLFISLVVLVAAVAAVGRMTFPFVLALLLGLPSWQARSSSRS